jgi:hypothetical protein
LLPDTVSSISDDSGVPIYPSSRQDRRTKVTVPKEQLPVLRSDPLWAGSFSSYRSNLQQLLLPKGLVGAYPKKVKRCRHTKTSYVIPDKEVLVYSTTSPFFDGQDVRSTTLELDGFNLWSELEFSASMSSRFLSASKCYTDSDYVKHDWFALADSFQERCDSFLVNDFFLGEDIAESDIFKDAILAVIQPTKAIRRFISAVKSSTKLRRKQLGPIAQALKGASSGDLFYKFAVKPAIEDIKSALSVHSRVIQRMNYLRSSSGRYVPVRVRQQLVADYVNNTIPSSHGTDYLQIESKYSVGSITGMARVRNDLRWDDTWSAYLQHFGVGKVIGLAWELIPFSFVIDWFTNAQERINHYTRLSTGSPFCDVTAICSSTKTVLKDNLLQTASSTSVYDSKPMTSPTSVLLASREQTLYSRDPGIPDTSGVVDFTTFDPSKLQSIFALLGQRFL